MSVYFKSQSVAPVYQNKIILVSLVSSQRLQKKEKKKIFAKTY